MKKIGRNSYDDCSNIFVEYVFSISIYVFESHVKLFRHRIKRDIIILLYNIIDLH